MMSSLSAIPMFCEKPRAWLRVARRRRRMQVESGVMLPEGGVMGWVAVEELGSVQPTRHSPEVIPTPPVL